MLNFIRGRSVLAILEFTALVASHRAYGSRLCAHGLRVEPDTDPARNLYPNLTPNYWGWDQGVR